MKELLIVLAGGLKDAQQLSDSTISRLDMAVKMYRPEQKILVVGAGAATTPLPLDARGFPTFESVDAVRYLLDKGLAVDKVLYETSSYDTIGNAYFSRFIHVDPADFDRLTIITSAFHMPRTQLTFDWIYGLKPGREYQLNYVAAPDDHFSALLLRRLHYKEEQRIDQMTALIPSIQSIPEFHNWMFTEHAAYCAHLEPVEIVSTLDEKDLLLESEDDNL